MDLEMENGGSSSPALHRKHSLGPAHIHIAWILSRACSETNLELPRGEEADFGFFVIVFVCKDFSQSLGWCLHFLFKTRRVRWVVFQDGSRQQSLGSITRCLVGCSLQTALTSSFPCYPTQSLQRLRVLS